LKDWRLVNEAEILAARPSKPLHDPWRPQAFFLEEERSRHGTLDSVATLFLTNRECPFRCLMCDLWKYTTEERVPIGAIPAQIEFALSQLPPARHIKLYNSGNFFDAQAIPPQDWPTIANLVRGFETVIVENHPKLCTQKCVEFQQMLGTELEVALGLETVHPEVLSRMNKGMSVEDFCRAAEFLKGARIPTRAFILLRPPYLSEEQGREWALKSIEFAFDCGVDCCSVIPTREGNGIMERLKEEGAYVPTSLSSLEWILEEGLKLTMTQRTGRVFVDLWDLERFRECPDCFEGRKERLAEMNRTQKISPGIFCGCGGSYG